VAHASVHAWDSASPLGFRWNRHILIRHTTRLHLRHGAKASGISFGWGARTAS